MPNKNQHIKDYLLYYLKSKFNPDFAVLLQGEWGCGKTWFIKEFIEKYSKSDGFHFLYITLYGVTSFSEIEDQIFQQLHPILSSKVMALTGKILKGVVRASLKIDLDDKQIKSTTISSELPDISLPDFLKNTEDRILVFDDVERCNLPINDLFGYINSFVEHQELRVILISNEKQLLVKENGVDNKDLYKKIKEKLIGKTFRVSHDIDSAFDFFITQIEKEKIKRFILSQKQTIINIFKIANYNNLRHLKQCIWDFDRFYLTIPSKYKSTSDLMAELLSIFLAFSFEIKSGNILPDDIRELESFFAREMIAKEKHDKDQKIPIHPIDSVIHKYSFIAPHDLILSEKSWRDLFDKGYLTKAELTESFDKCKYFIDENTPVWVKLWHYRDLEDDDFSNLLNKMLEQWKNEEFKEPGEILHICGLLLNFSQMGLLPESDRDIFKECKNYIDNIKQKGEFLKYSQKDRYKIFERDQWNGLGYAGRDLEEFKSVSSYLEEKIYESKADSLPQAGKDLLELIASDPIEAERIISFNEAGDSIYKNFAIFKFIEPVEFFDVFMNLKNTEKINIISSIRIRYQDNLNFDLYDEISFLEKLNLLFLREAEERKGKVSGHILRNICSKTLTNIIANITKVQSDKLTNQKK